MLQPTKLSETRRSGFLPRMPHPSQRFRFLPFLLILCTMTTILPLHHAFAQSVSPPTATPTRVTMPTSKHPATITPQRWQQIRQKLQSQIHVTQHKKGTDTLSATAPAGVEKANLLLPAYNNTGTSDDSTPGSANFDGGHVSYSAQALQSAGVVPGQTVTFDGISFVWPSPGSGAMNNYQAAGQVIPVTPVGGAVTVGFLGAASNGPSSGTATLTYTDASTQTFSLGMSDWTLTGGLSYGNSTVVTMPYQNTNGGKRTTSVSLFYAHVNLAVGKTVQSVTLPTTVNQGQLHIFAVGTGSYNNVGISNDTAPGSGNFDAQGDSFSAQEFQDPNGLNVQPGDDLNYNGMDLIWPNVAAGLPDNYQAEGQTIPVNPVANANTIGFVGAATRGATSGTATITYTDGTTQNFTLGFSDWTLSGFTLAPTFSNRLFASLTHENTQSGGQNNTNPFLFYTEQTLQAGKTIQSITLPDATTPGQVHVFTIGTRSGNAYPNNVGTSDDASTLFANYDGGTNGISYSIEALKASGIYPGQNVSFNGVSFAWPDSASVSPDNYQASGQTIAVTPVASANTLAFLGSATNGTASGTAMVTFTDSSTQTISLGFSDWWSTSTPFANTEVVAVQPYLNTFAGQVTVPNNLYYSDFSIPSTKTIQSVTLPSSVTGGVLHVFAIGTRAGLAYNNGGVSDDSHPTYGSFDGGGSSYSSQALQSTGVSAGQPFVTNGVVFSWPNVSPGFENNYLVAGQTLPVTPVANANTVAFLGSSVGGSASGTATITYTDASTSTFTLGFSDWWYNGPGSLAFGNTLSTTSSYLNSPTGRQATTVALYEAEAPLQAGKTIQSITLPATVGGSGKMHVFTVSTKASTLYNNSGVSDDLHSIPGNLDGAGNSYSAQALQNNGISVGQTVIRNGVAFTWPAAAAGLPNNYQSAGQTIAVTPVPNATRLAFLGASDNGPSSGTVTITYTNASTQTFVLNLSDWGLNGGTSQPVAGDTIVETMSYHNSQTGKQVANTYLFYTDVALQAGKTVQSVTLPTTVNQGNQHIFAIGTLGTGVYNNAGVSDDVQPTFANFDGHGESYSAQALQMHGIVAGQNVIVNGVTFTWPAISSGLFNNYQAAGQTIAVTPVASADTVAMLGSATNGQASGSAILTFTDSTTQTITLGFSDWQPPTGALFTNTQSIAIQSYLNLHSGKAMQKNSLYETEFRLPSGKTLQSVTLPSSVTGGQLHVFAISTRSGLAYNNAGVSDDSNPTFANFDGNGDSYSAQSLQNIGMSEGQTIMIDGVAFAWPNAVAGTSNNYQASGQKIPVSPVTNATRLAFLGAASANTGPASGTATITYTDSSTQTFTLSLSDWALNGGTSQPATGNRIAATLPSYNSPTGKKTGNTYLFYTDVALTGGKTVQSITLPSTVSQGTMHIFAIGTLGTSVYNNAGVSDDAHTAFASFDGSGNTGDSYSAQALQTNGIVPGQIIMYNGVSFTWPAAPFGQFNNYQAAGQTIPVTPVSNATTLALLGSSSKGAASGTATLTYTDASTQTITLGFSDWANSGALASNTVLAATQPYRNTPTGREPVATHLYYTEFSLPTGKTLQSVTLPTTVTGGQLHIFALGTTVRIPYNNRGVSDDSQPSLGNIDGNGNSYSAQALQSQGFVPGQNVISNGVVFSWPNVTSGSANNYQAAGQTIPVTPVANATRLAFLGSATYGPSSGTVTITYTDATTQTFTLSLSDWGLNGNTSQPVSGNRIAAVLSYENASTGKQTVSNDLFYTDVALQSGKTVQSITLPGAVSQGQLHIFAIGTRADSIYNNAGVSDDTSPSFASFDGNQFSYSAQALQNNGILSGQNVTVNGVTFVWPNVPSGQFNNYQASGQTIAVTPVANANTLAFLGSSAYGASSGTATITYSDTTTQIITLSFADWQLGTPTASNLIAATQTYLNSRTGKTNLRNYLYYSEFALTAGKTVQSVTLPSTITGGQLHIFAVGTRNGVNYNNVGGSNDTQPTSGNLDGLGDSYSAQAFRTVGIAPGKTLMNNGVSFVWPNVPVGQFNNYQAAGQTIPVTPVANATQLAFLGSATAAGPSTGTAIIKYSDASTQAFSLTMSDWALNGGTSQPAVGNSIAATVPYYNSPTGKKTGTLYLFYTDVALQAGKTLQSVTLPSTVSQGQLHIFAIGTRAISSYNNVGTSDDAHSTFANYDGGGASYSTTALQKQKITAGGTVLSNGVSFVWPNASGGSLNNYQANGQTIPVVPIANATTLALLGSSTTSGLAPSASGIATITYTDQSTQTFTLLVSDWTLNAGQAQLAPGNKIVAAMPYRNTATGKQSVNVYVFYTDVTLQTGKTLQSITLPTGGLIHVFAIGTK